MTDFSSTKATFHLPDGVIYLDGNSLGPLPKSAPSRMQSVLVQEWGDMLITGWNNAGWMDQPRKLGDRIGQLIGAEPGYVVIGDTLSIKVYQALASALELRSDRKVILTDSGNFPSDLYMAQGLIASLNRGHELRVVEPEALENAITDDVAVTLITEVDYRTGRKHDMKSITAKAHSAGALTIWDLAHSAGAFPVDLVGCEADFAVGCTYKYLNAGPGAPAFIYVSPKHANVARPALSGWLGHEAPFLFDRAYRPAADIDRMRVGTPPVLAMAALEAALDIWDSVDMNALRDQSVKLSEAFISAVESTCPNLQLASPRDPKQRGSQVSFRHPEGYAIVQALIANGVIGDFRAPDILRFGFTPLYQDADDIAQAAAILDDIMRTNAWDRPEFKTRKAVT